MTDKKTDTTEKTLSSEYFFKGRIMNFRKDTVECPGGRITTREVCEHCDGVAILPIDENGVITLVSQFRYPFGKEILEAPAGKVEEGEPHLDCGVRELSEETGYTAKKMTYLGFRYLSPGCFTERIHLYIAEGLEEGSSHPDEGELLEIKKLPLAEAVKMVEANLIEDAKTEILILRAARYFGI